MAAVTNYHELVAKDTQIYYVTVLQARGPRWISVDKNQGVGTAVFLLEALWETHSLTVLALKGCPLLWPVATSRLQSQQQSV